MCSVRQQYLGFVTQVNICATNCSGELHYETLCWMTGSDSLPKKTAFTQHLTTQTACPRLHQLHSVAEDQECCVL